MAVDGGVGDVNAATADDAVEDATVKVIEVSGRGGEAEANGAEGDRSEAFESGFGIDKLGEHLGEMEVVADGLLKCAQAEVANGEPEREGSEGTGKLDGFFEESKALDGVGGERAGVVAGMGEGTARISRIAVEETAAASGLVEPLVGIEGDGIGEADSFEGFGDGKRSECAVSSVDVQPEIVLTTDFGDVANGIDAAGGGGTGAGDDGDGFEIGVEVALNSFAQIVGAHAEGVVDGDEPDGIVAQAEKRGGLGVGHVGFSGTVDDAAVNAGQVGGGFGFAGHAEGHEVG